MDADDEHWIEVPSNKLQQIIDDLARVTGELSNLQDKYDKLSVKYTLAQEKIDLLENAKKDKKWLGHG